MRYRPRACRRRRATRSYGDCAGGVSLQGTPRGQGIQLHGDVTSKINIHDSGGRTWSQQRHSRSRQSVGPGQITAALTQSPKQATAVTSLRERTQEHWSLTNAWLAHAKMDNMRLDEFWRGLLAQGAIGERATCLRITLGAVPDSDLRRAPTRAPDIWGPASPYLDLRLQRSDPSWALYGPVFTYNRPSKWLQASSATFSSVSFRTRRPRAWGRCKRSA